MTEYPLLVEKLAKSTPPDHPDSACLLEALQRARTLCEQVGANGRPLVVGNLVSTSFLLFEGEWGNADEGKLGAVGVASNPCWLANGGESAPGEDHLQLSHQLGWTKEVPTLWPPEKDQVWEGAGWVPLQWLSTFDHIQQILWGKSVLFWQTPQLQPQVVQTAPLSQHHCGKNFEQLQLSYFCEYFQVGPSLRSDDDEVGFSLKLGPESALGLDALSVNDRTLWTSRLAEACSNFEETEKRFLTRQKSGKWAFCRGLIIKPYFMIVGCIRQEIFYVKSTPIFSSSVEETETKESKGRLLLIIVKGEHIKDDGGKRHVCKQNLREGFPSLVSPLRKAFSDLTLEYMYIFFCSSDYYHFF